MLILKLQKKSPFIIDDNNRNFDKTLSTPKHRSRPLTRDLLPPGSVISSGCGPKNGRGFSGAPMDSPMVSRENESEAIDFNVSVFLFVSL